MANIGVGLFVDLDGTLADSITVMRTVYSRFLERFGKAGSDTEFALLNGPPLDKLVATIAAAHQLSTPTEELLTTYRDLIEAAYKDVVPNAAARDLLETARRFGLRTGVVTSNSVNLTRAWLRRVGLMEMVDTVVGGDEVSQGKPNPLPYLLALKRTACDARESLAVEDSITGGQASIAAGLRTFMLSDAHHTLTHGVLPITTLGEVRDFLLRRYQE